MATRKIRDIIADMRTAAADDSRDFDALAKKTYERADELDAILTKINADNKFINIFGFLLLLFIGAFAIITYMSNDDLREDVTQKKEIISKFEQAVKHDMIHTYTDKDGHEITVPSLLNDNMKLINKISELELQLTVRDIQLSEIEARYGIKVMKDKSSNVSYHLEGKKADSAMLLLPVFRDRVSYDSIKNQWSVTRRYVTVGDKTYSE